MEISWIASQSSPLIINVTKCAAPAGFCLCGVCVVWWRSVSSICELNNFGVLARLLESVNSESRGNSDCFCKIPVFVKETVRGCRFMQCCVRRYRYCHLIWKPTGKHVCRSVCDPPGGSGQPAVFSQGAAGGRGQCRGPGTQLWPNGPPSRHRDWQCIAGGLPAAGGTPWLLGRLGANNQSEQRPLLRLCWLSIRAAANHYLINKVVTHLYRCTTVRKNFHTGETKRLMSSAYKSIRTFICKDLKFYYNYEGH